MGNCLKRGVWTVCRFKGGLARKRGGVSEVGGLISQCTLCCIVSLDFDKVSLELVNVSKCSVDLFDC